MTAMSQNLRLAEVIFLAGQGFRYVFTVDHKKICYRCCGVEREKFALNPLWLIKADHVNKTGCPIACDNCSQLIEPFYPFK